MGFQNFIMTTALLHRLKILISQNEIYLKYDKLTTSVICKLDNLNSTHNCSVVISS